MTKTCEYNPYLTEREFSPKDTFRRERKSRVLYDAQEKILGSVSDSAICDLYGNQVARRQSQQTREGENKKKIRVTEYVSDTRAFRLVGDKLYAVSPDSEEEWIGWLKTRQRDPVHIVMLSALAVILAVTIILLALIGLPYGDRERPVIDIADSGGSWEAQGTVAVFPRSLKPGSSGNYEFILNNPHDAAMDYTFSLEPLYNGEKIDYFPLTFRLRMNNVLLESEEWKTVDELKFDQMTIWNRSTQVFTLEWRWAFENGNDDGDTFIGADGGKISLVLRVTAQAR